MLLVKCLCILLIFATNAYGWRMFHRGRIYGGNLGVPFKGEKKSVESFPDEWFVQSLDHFDPIDTTTWKQRYFTNANYFNASKRSPVFLMIGGEGEASTQWMDKGTWIDYAKKFGALCFQLEHRYYGKSHPTRDLSVKNLQYLTSQQALADLAAFITAMNERYHLKSSNKWIAFGGSYPGSLAAWLRLKYPHLVHGAMSASGPLLAKVDFLEYFRVVDNALDTYGPQCVGAVKQGTSLIHILLNHMIGQRTITEKFKLCDPIEYSANNKNDVSNFFETLAGNFAGVVQYNKDNRIGNKTAAHKYTIDTLCDIMTDENQGTLVDRLAAINSLLLNASDQKCLDYKYDKMINESRNTSWDSAQAEGGRQWTYQTCTEFGFFQSSSYAPHVFGADFPVDFFVQQCVDIFGAKFNAEYLDAAVARTNTFYGALDIDVSNVVFVHGSIDPWHALGIYLTVEQNAPAIYINGTAHCANMYPARESDLPSLKAARIEIENLIGGWLRL